MVPPCDHSDEPAASWIENWADYRKVQERLEQLQRERAERAGVGAEQAALGENAGENGSSVEGQGRQANGSSSVVASTAAPTGLLDEHNTSVALNTVYSKGSGSSNCINLFSTQLFTSITVTE